MTRSQRISLASCLLGCLGASHASAQSSPLDARTVRPAVMLLVDTSGSMERVPDDGTNPDCDSCVPTCTGNPTLDSANKTRWALTVEALTGTIQNYTCTAQDRSTYPTDSYDYGYYLPHIQFASASVPDGGVAQVDDGILDSFANRVKFGLMTFDGVGTTIGGDTLVPWSSWFDTTSQFYTRAYGEPGMFSYGPARRLSFPHCPTDYGVNAGSRKPGTEPGSMVRVGRSDNQSDILRVNNQIQQSLLQVRPFGGTPIAAMLDDLKYYLSTGTSAEADPDSDLNRTGDPLYACRKRKAILITDGAPDKLFRDARFQCDSTTASDCAADSSPTSDPDGGVAPAPTGKCQCPYDPAESLAAQLIASPNNLLDQLIVVAYNVHEPTALATLNGIGAKGTNSTEPLPCSSTQYPYLVMADGPTELRGCLDLLLSASQPGITSRSIPVSVNTGDDVLGPDSKRFDITAGFQVSTEANKPWSGLLFRRRVTCGGQDGTEVIDDTDFDASKGDMFHEVLNSASPSARKLLTAMPTTAALTVSGSLVNKDYRPYWPTTTNAPNYDNRRLPQTLDSTLHRVTTDVQNHKKPDGSAFSLLESVDVDTSVRVVQDVVLESIDPDARFDGSMSAAYFGDADNDGAAGLPGDRQRIVDFVRGTSRPNNLMADIYHSNPVVLVPLNSASTARFGAFNAQYGAWLRTIASTGSDAHYTEGRPGVVFVGTNDGVLHAFNLDTWHYAGTTYEAGQELWGFVPPALFGKMASMLVGHQLMFDGTPVVQDVVLQKTSTGAPLFRTILISAVRGAPAYIALDVTFPESPVFLWQVSFADLGDTVATPALTQVEMMWNNELQQRAVAILPGGMGVEPEPTCPSGATPVKDVTRAQFPEQNTRNVRCWNRRGRSLYVVDVATGQLIQQFGAEHFPSPITGSVVVDSIGVNRASAGYFFDHDGILWRLSMLHSDPSEWRVQPVYDMFADPVGTSSTNPSWAIGRRPTYPPTLTYDTHGNLVILAGTGDADEPLDSARQRVVSLVEYRNSDLQDTEIAGTMALNWQIDLAPNEGVTGPITVFDNKAYFTTFESMVGASQCSLGTSRFYGAHAYMNDGTGALPPAPKPEWKSLPTDTPVLSKIFDQGGSNLLLGITIARDPICQTTARTLNPVTNQSVPASPPGGGNYRLRGVLAGSSTGGELIGQNAKIKELPAQSIPHPSKTTITSWASFVD